MIPAMYPLLKEAYRLDFAQIGLITLAFQVTSSLLQPVLGYVTDRRPWAYAMVAGMASTLLGVVGLALATNYAIVLVSVALSDDPPCSIPKRPGWRVMQQRATRVSHRAYSRSADMPDTPWDRC